MSHTPGPWEVDTEEEEGRSWVVIRGAGFYIANVSGGIGPGITEANASLIAAAPDLLEALIAVRDDFDDDCTAERGEEIRAQIAAAIAKATG